MVNILLDLDNIDQNGESPSNTLTLSNISINDLKKLGYNELLKIQLLSYNHIKAKDTYLSIDEFYEQLKSFKFKVKAIHKSLISFKFNKLCDLLLLLRSLDSDYIEALYYNKDILKAKEYIKIIPSKKLIEYDEE